MNNQAISLPDSPVPYVERVAQIICTGLYPEAHAAGKTLADFPTATRENLLTIAEAVLLATPATAGAPEGCVYVTKALLIDYNNMKQRAGCAPQTASRTLTDEAFAEIDDLLRGCHKHHAGDGNHKGRIEKARALLATASARA